MSKEFKPQLIAFDERSYNRQRIKFEEYQILYADTQRTLESILSLDLKEVDLSKESAFKTIAKMYAESLERENTLGLSGIRLMELRDIPVSNIMKSLDELRLKYIEEPVKDEYKAYTSNEDENERLTVAKDFLAILPKLHTKVSFQNPLSAPIKMNGSETVVNIYYIKKRF